MSEPIICVRHLSKSFGNLPVLRDVSLKVETGEKVALLGPSGSGKTTLLRCLNRLERPDAGEIVVDGILLDDSESKVNRVRADVGMVFQRFHLFPHKTALENVALAPELVRKLSRDEAKRRAEALLEKVGLADKRDAYPFELSGGQQQRVAIARALAMTPKVLLCDEVTSALDPELVAEVLDVLRQLAHEGMTMLLVTHEVRFAEEIADRVLFMDNGQILEEGPPTAVIRNPSHPRTREFLERVLW